MPISSVATSIFAARTSTFIEIATDGKATYRGVPGPPVVCKIYRSGPTYFTVAGLVHDRERGFYVNDIVAASVSGSESFSEKMLKAEQALAKPVRTELLRLRTEDKRSFDQAVKNGSGAVSVMLAEYRDGVPYLGGFSLNFVAEPEPNIATHQSQCPGDCGPAGDFFLFSGYSEEGVRYIHQNPGLSVDDLLRGAVETAIGAHPRDVGPPIVRLRIDQNGATWIANDSNCPIESRPLAVHGL